MPEWGMVRGTSAFIHNPERFSAKDLQMQWSIGAMPARRSGAQAGNDQMIESSKERIHVRFI